MAATEPPIHVDFGDLLPGGPVERVLAPGEVHVYGMRLAKDDCLEAVIEQIDVDVVAAWLSPDGDSLAEVDHPTGASGPERVVAVAEAPGRHRLVIRAERTRASGRYSLRSAAPRPAGALDRHRSRAQRAMARGNRQRAAGTPPALRAALEAFEAAAQAWGAASDAGDQGLAIRRAGQARLDLGDLAGAQEAFERALALFRRLGAAQDQVRVLNDLCAAQRLLGRPRQSQTSCREALEIARREKYQVGEAAALNNLGVLHDSVVEPREALVHYAQALSLYRRMGDRAREASTLHNLGMCYLALNRLLEAGDLFEQALAVRRAGQDRRGEAITLTALARVHRLGGDLPQSLDRYDDALRLRKEVGDARGEAVTLDQRAVTLSELGRAEEALVSHRQALATFSRIGDRAGEAYALANIGWLQESRGRTEEARPVLEQSLSRFRELQDGDGAANALAALARTDRRQGRLGSAWQHIEEGLRLVESVRLRIGRPELQVSYFASRHEYYELAIEVLMERHAADPMRGYDAQALAMAERSQGRALLESLGRGITDTVAPPASTASRARIARVEQRRLALARERGTALEAAALERDIRSLFLELHQEEARQGVDGRGFRAAEATVGVRRIQESLLDEDSLLLWYALGDRQSVLWIVGREVFESRMLPDRTTIETLARRVHELLSRRPPSHAGEQARLSAAELSRLVLGPASHRLSGKRLVVVADGALQYVPFSALPTPLGERPLVLDHEVVGLPSAAVLATIRRRGGRRSAAKALAVFADPVFDRNDPRLAPPASGPPSAGIVAGPGTPRSRGDPASTRWPRLPHSEREAEAILRLVPPDGRYAALGFDANREAVVDGRLGDYRTIHFATHGVLNAEHPELSALVLSLVDREGREREGILWAHDVRHLDLAADLVVLSACRTAVGREVRGEGLMSLTRDFLQAGANRTVVSLWNVDDAATAALMGRFYEGMLQRRLRPAAALRAAQVGMLSAPGAWQAPYYWAGFVLQGDWK